MAYIAHTTLFFSFRENNYIVLYYVGYTAYLIIYTRNITDTAMHIAIVSIF